MNTMDRKYINEHHIVVRYLANELSAAERQAFEEYYVDDPEIIEDLEAAARFKSGLAYLRRKQQLADLVRHRPWWREHSRGLIAVAASTLMAVAVAYFTLAYPPFQPALVAERTELRDWRGPLPLAGYSLLTQLRRTIEEDTPIALPPTPQVLELRVLLGDSQSTPPYRAQLARAENGDTRTVASLDGLPLNGSRFVRLFVNSSRLRPGRYSVLIADANGIEAKYGVVAR